MTGKELIKLAEQQGWVLNRINGSHHIFKHPTKTGSVVIAVHGKKEVSKGLQQSILKKIGLL